MDNLSFTLRLLCRDDNDGGEKTRSARLSALMMISRQLRQEGFRGMNASSLKPKHVNALLKRWKAEGISPDTIKNRLSCLRWWTQKVGKSGTLPADNATLGIVEPRLFVNEGMILSGLERIQDPHIRLNLALQQAFGLQPEESIKFQPSYADRGDSIALKDTWTKRMRARTVPLTTPEQRTLLDQVHRLAGAGALIPVERNYIEQLRRYEGHCRTAGLSPLHGLRYHYAQSRYETHWLEATGRRGSTQADVDAHAVRPGWNGAPNDPSGIGRRAQSHPFGISRAIERSRSGRESEAASTKPVRTTCALPADTASIHRDDRLQDNAEGVDPCRLLSPAAIFGTVRSRCWPLLH